MALRGVPLGLGVGLGLLPLAAMIGLVAGRASTFDDERGVIALVTGFGSGSSARMATVAEAKVLAEASKCLTSPATALRLLLWEP